VCERHVGTGISKQDIIEKELPFPLRDMLPISIEEEIICYADKFYSKSAKDPTKPKSIKKIISKLHKHGEDKALRFREFVDMFGTDYIYE